MTKKQKVKIQRISIYIVLIFMAIMALFPIFFSLSASLRTQEDLFASMYPFSIKSLLPSKVTMENYIGIFKEYNFIRPIMNTIIVTACTIVFGCLINSVAAFALSAFNFKGKRLIIMLIMISFMVPFEAIAIPTYSVVNNLGMIDKYSGMIVPAIADGLVVFLFMQFFKDFQPSILEAARVDGASWIRIYFKIIMPLCVPVIITAGLMVFMNQWNSYLWPLLVARSQEIRTIQIALNEFRGERFINWAYIYAGSMISAVIPIALFLPLQKYFVEGITAGGVKG